MEAPMINVTKHPYYRRWQNMKARCYNPNHHLWKHYGGRGITVCNEWLNNSSAYIEFISSLPNAEEKGCTIDRINNDKNYDRNNIRWATHSQQMLNRRGSGRNTSGYTGVYYSKRRSNWQARIHQEGVRIQKSFKTKEQAIVQRKAWELKFNQ